MKVQTRLSLFSSFTFGIIFLVIAVLIYGLYYHNARKTVYSTLKKTSLITAIFYLEEDELNKEEFSKAKRQFEEFVSNSHFQVYDENDQVKHGSVNLPVSADILNQIRDKRVLSFSDRDYFCYGIFYEDNQGDFVVITRERRELLDSQLNILLWILIGAFFIGISAIIFFSRWMAYRAYRPFRTAIRQVDAISTHDLDKQIRIPDTKDELQDLIITFNNLLSKIAETFVMQKNFVNYVSHEFKTPLTSIMGNLEVFSLKDRSPEEYRNMATELIVQITQLEETLNTLLVISDLRNKSEMDSQVRIDEIVWEIITKISGIYRKSNVQVSLDVLPEDEHLLVISTDRTQLLIALFNLIENAVKYSQGKQVDIFLYKESDNLILSITDKGIGIPADQITEISKPFYRAGNTSQISGSGVGLSIALRILEKNRIKYKITSLLNEGTTVTLIF